MGFELNDKYYLDQYGSEVQEAIRTIVDNDKESGLILYSDGNRHSYWGRLPTWNHGSGIVIQNNTISLDPSIISQLQNLSGKLDKVTTYSAYNRVYGVTGSGGTQVMFDIATIPTPSKLVQYNSNGQILTNSPTTNTSAANKYYVDNYVIPNPIGSFSEILETIKIGDNYYNLGGDSDYLSGTDISIINKTISVISSTDIDNDKLVKRTSAGQVLVPEEPTEDYHAASKFYVDSHSGGGAGMIGFEYIEVVV